MSIGKTRTENLQKKVIGSSYFHIQFKTVTKV